MQFEYEGETLGDKIASALRIAEIKVRIEHACQQFNQKISPDDEDEEGSFHFPTAEDLTDCGIVDAADFAADLGLPPEIETQRKAAQEEINQQLQDKFGKSDETTVFVVTDQRMTENSIYW